MSLPKALHQLAQLFLTASCPLCHRPTAEILCTDCHRQLLACQWSGTIQGNAVTSGKLALPNDTVLPVFPWAEYRSVLKQTLALLKYGRQADLGVWLGCQLGKCWQAKYHNNLHDQKPVVVPIPLHQQRLQQRGYNQAALIARGFCRVTGFSLAEHGLIRTKVTNAMHSLGATERQSNLRGAFQLGTGLPSRSQGILLIDDIYTTGTTAYAAAAPLVQARYAIIGITTVARAVLASPLAGKSIPDHLDQTLTQHPNR